MTLRIKRAKSLFDLKCSEGLDLVSELTRWPVCKRYLEKQVAKCVTECKSQASDAKKAVQSLTKSKKKRFQLAAGSAGEPDDFDSADGWSSDEFDTGDEDDQNEKDYSNNITEVGFSVSDFGSDNGSTNGPESVASSEGSGQYNDVTLEIRSSMPGRTGVWNLKGPASGRELDTSSPEPSVVLKSMSPLHTDGESSPTAMNRPTTVIANSKTTGSPKSKTPSPATVKIEKVTPNWNTGSLVPRRFASKLQRPHSLPPAPPIPRNRLEPEREVLSEEKCWEYEIPNSGIPSQQPQGSAAPVKVLPVAPLPPLRHRTNTALVNGALRHAQTDRRSLQETVRHQDQDIHSGTCTYENIDQNEEGNYETVEDDHLPVKPHKQQTSPGTKPFVPPRKPAPLLPHMLLPLSKKAVGEIGPTLAEPPSTTERLPAASPLPPVPEVPVPDSRTSISLLMNEFRSKLLEGGVPTSAGEADPGSLPPGFARGNSEEKVNGSTPCPFDRVSPCAVTPAPPPTPSPLPPPNSEVVESAGNDDSCSMSVRPLPPVPSSQERPRRLKGEDLGQLPYYINVERDEAERCLLSLDQDDAYLVRPSRRAGSDNPHTLTLIHKGRPFHLNIRLRPDGLYALGRRKEQEVVFGSVSALVSHHQQYPIYLSSQGATVGTSLLKRHP